MSQSPMVSQTTEALADRRSEGVRRTSDLCWPEARILAEAMQDVHERMGAICDDTSEPDRGALS